MSATNIVMSVNNDSATSKTCPFRFAVTCEPDRYTCKELPSIPLKNNSI
jgi:hypothetical protein